ncbi:nitrous oxide reductase accessory protein NosL [Paucibacter sp. APW11]|uniref:Nitrous oxide reductase accessory protein NosL n=1 Tax=Roseateles aquae TaxID=3077235 RepID=A0ABU3P616_9BURK|nr:nitrous oxide reductase accessory protein NosL [Paucibacter sp. APW11]MDT8998022.1 nitrous oxide reductase accessory protein NosL [Paucibacter sp. APW11]
MNEASLRQGRRQFFCACAALATAGLAGLAGLSACSPAADSATSAAPGNFDGQSSCSLDGMLLGDYPGPKGQIRYRGDAQPSWFCDSVELLSTLLKPEQLKPVASAHVQDMAKADWERPQGHWIDARQAVYVLGSKRQGSMGPTAASFADVAAAQAFATQWGGRVLRFAELRTEMVDLSGGALHDSRM